VCDLTEFYTDITIYFSNTYRQVTSRGAGQDLTERTKEENLTAECAEERGE